MLNSNKIFSNLDEAFDKIESLIKSKSFLSGEYVCNKDICITSTEDAIIFATDQDVDYLKGIEYQYWTGILGDESYVVEIVNKRSNLNDQLLRDFKSKFNKYSDEIDMLFLKVLNEKKFPKDLTNSLASELLIIIDLLIFFDELPTFWENVLTVLGKGGFPCGWKGKYPEGQLIVYNHKV